MFPEWVTGQEVDQVLPQGQFRGYRTGKKKNITR